MDEAAGSGDVVVVVGGDGCGGGWEDIMNWGIGFVKLNRSNWNFGVLARRKRRDILKCDLDITSCSKWKCAPGSLPRN